MAGVATFSAILGSVFVGFLRLSGFWLLPLAALATYGMKHYDESEKQWTVWDYARSFIVAILMLALFEWVARLASVYLL